MKQNPPIDGSALRSTACLIVAVVAMGAALVSSANPKAEGLARYREQIAAHNRAMVANLDE